MIGYIYVTKTACGCYYVGQHKRQKFDESYFGSGIQLRGKAIESCTMIDSSDYFYELNAKERFWIQWHMKEYDHKCLNMNDYADTNLGVVYVHKQTNIIVIGPHEMKSLYNISTNKILAIFRGEIEPFNGLIPEDWERLTYKEYDIRRLII